jgi:hypothetical protein
MTNRWCARSIRRELVHPEDAEMVRRLIADHRGTRAHALSAPNVVARLSAAFLQHAGDPSVSQSLELVTPHGPATALHREVRIVASGNDEWVCIGQLAAGVAHEINTPLQYIGDNLHFAESALEDLLRFMRELEAAVASSSLTRSS